MPAKSYAQKQSAKEELFRRRNGEDPYKFRGISDEDLEEIADTPEDDLPERIR